MLKSALSLVEAGKKLVVTQVLVGLESLQEALKPEEPLAPPTQEDKESLAHELWRQAGCPDGRSDEFWSEAEQILEGQSEKPAGVGTR